MSDLPLTLNPLADVSAFTSELKKTVRHTADQIIKDITGTDDTATNDSHNTVNDSGTANNAPVSFAMVATMLQDLKEDLKEDQKEDVGRLSKKHTNLFLNRKRVKSENRLYDDETQKTDDYDEDNSNANCCCVSFEFTTKCEDDKDKRIKQLEKDITKSETQKKNNKRKQVEYYDTIKDKVTDIKRLLGLELTDTNSKLTAEQKLKRRKRKKEIDKMLEDIERYPDHVLDPTTWSEIEQILEELHKEQKERLKDNIALTEDIIIENDVILLDANIDTNNHLDMDKNQVISNSLDILAIFLKSEKILYTEAKSYCEQQLNFLMMPAIFISALTTVLTMALSSYVYGDIIIASLTAVNSFLLAIISYLKLDAKSEAHKTSAYQFDKLQSKCEFGSGRVIFFNRKETDLSKNITALSNVAPSVELIGQKNALKDEDFKEVYDLVDMIEIKVNEIKDMNKFILPEYIRTKYSNLYSTNIFSTIKLYITEESQLRYELDQCVQSLKTLRKKVIPIVKLPETVESRGGESTIIYSWNINVKNKRDIERQLFQTRENYAKLDRMVATNYNTGSNDCFSCTNYCIWMKT
jgi:hypothetical protein